MSTWGRTRQRLAATAVLTATFTGAAGAALGASGWHLLAACAYVSVAIIALFIPAAIAMQVVVGQLLAGSIALGPDRTAPLQLLPIIASIVVTAELLAVIARLDAPLERVVTDELRRAGAAVLVAAGVFAVVTLFGSLRGATGGLFAIALAAAACIAIALLLVAGRAHSPRPGP